MELEVPLGTHTVTPSIRRSEARRLCSLVLFRGRPPLLQPVCYVELPGRCEGGRARGALAVTVQLVPPSAYHK